MSIPQPIQPSLDEIRMRLLEAQATQRRRLEDAVPGDDDLTQALARRAEQMLEDIEIALQEIDAGSYGSCRRCGGQIRWERLEAVPHTRHCATCARV